MVYFVGAGTGAVDLITVRGMRLLEQADVIIYAGSLVNPELLVYAKNDCEMYNSAKLTLEEVVRIMDEAEKENGRKSVVCWGDGSPLREFLYVDDLAELCVFLMDQYSGDETVNAGTGKEISIKGLTELVAKVVGYEGDIMWDTSKPNGTPRKLLDVSKAEKLGWHYKTELEEGIRLSYEDFLKNDGRR